ncbi:MAG TPA: triacylglycerol lipase, partial [Archangium sp.]|nr:triacylglycerol lipase [Archangium sp.]
MATKHHIYLVPGFFGFANLGELLYFGHVRDYFVAEMARRGVDVEVVQVLSHPTGSIRTRAADLFKAIEASAKNDDGPIHLIGHS